VTKAAEEATTGKVATDKATSAKAATDKSTVEKETMNKAAAMKVATDKAIAAKVAADKATATKAVEEAVAKAVADVTTMKTINQVAAAVKTTLGSVDSDSSSSPAPVARSM
jgi:hypothetical protein